MTTYTVHVFREMRLKFTRIEAPSPLEAALRASSRTSDEAEEIDGWDGADLGALVDIEGDTDSRDSELIDFEPQQLMKAVPKLREALRGVLLYAESEWESLLECRRRDGAAEFDREVAACEAAIESARQIIAETEGMGV